MNRQIIIFSQGINKGSSVFLFLLKQLSEPGHRNVAFYHRNSSDLRKEMILKDLKLPLNSAEKQLVAVVAPVSLGRN